MLHTQTVQEYEKQYGSDVPNLKFMYLFFTYIPSGNEVTVIYLLTFSHLMIINIDWAIGS